MNTPLIGTREQNYRFFYLASAAAVSSTLILLVITGYTAYISTEVETLISDMNDVITELRVIIPNVKDSIKLLKTICNHKNFTDSYGNLYNKSSLPGINFLLD